MAFSWIGNELCLDFHNTTQWSGALETENTDGIGSGKLLAEWLFAAGVVDKTGARAIELLRPKESASLMDQARAIRRVIHDVFGNAAGRHSASLQLLNGYLASVVLQVSKSDDDELFLSTDGIEEMHPVLAPVVWSAASLLVSPYGRLVRECSHRTCGRLFVDLSRRGNRRWCDMTTCGNREKARRHHAKYSKT